jgi:hypothetical protein
LTNADLHAAGSAEHDGIGGLLVAAMSMGDTVSVRGPMFLVNGTPTIICSKVLKR